MDDRAWETISFHRISAVGDVGGEAEQLVSRGPRSGRGRADAAASVAGCASAMTTPAPGGEEIRAMVRPIPLGGPP